MFFTLIFIITFLSTYVAENKIPQLQLANWQRLAIAATGGLALTAIPLWATGAAVVGYGVYKRKEIAALPFVQNKMLEYKGDK